MPLAANHKDYPLSLDCPHCATEAFLLRWLEYKAERNNEKSGPRIIAALIEIIATQLEAGATPLERQQRAGEVLVLMATTIADVLQTKEDHVILFGNAPTSEGQH